MGRKGGGGGAQGPSGVGHEKRLSKSARGTGMSERQKLEMGEMSDTRGKVLADAQKPHTRSVMRRRLRDGRGPWPLRFQVRELHRWQLRETRR